MLRRSPIFIALIPQQVSSGLQPDKHPLHMLLWEDAENVTFYGGKVRRRLPPSAALDIGLEPIRGISQQRSSDGVRWLWAASGKDIYRWYGPPKELIYSGASYQEDETFTADADFWDFTQYGDWTIFNKGQSARIFKPGLGVSIFGDAPTGVRRFMKKLSYVMAIGYGARGTQVGWSDSSNIESWTATEANNAGALAIDDLDTRIKAAANLGQSISVFAEDQMALVNFINAPFYFGQKTVLDGIGAVGKMAVASDGRNNVGVGRNGVWWTDSLSYRYIDEGFLHDYLQDNVNWAQKSKITANRNDYTGCFDFHFPMLGSNINNEGWSFDPRTGGWSKIPGVEMQDERRLFEYVLIGTNEGKVQFAQNAPNSEAPLTLKTRPLLMQVQSAEGFVDAHTVSKIDEVELLLKAATGIEFRLGCSHDAHNDYEYSPWMEALPKSRTYKMPQMPDGVYWRLEFRSIVDNWEFDLQGFMFFGAVEGTKRTNQ